MASGNTGGVGDGMSRTGTMDYDDHSSYTNMNQSAATSVTGATSSSSSRNIINAMLNRMFASCDDDRKGSVHRGWGLCLIFVLIYFIVSILEMISLGKGGGSRALEVAAIWTGVVHLMLGILGTFVLKRFPTSFSVGFLMGVLLVLANQNLILFGSFHNYRYGTSSTNHAFANIGLSLFAILFFYATLLFHFRRSVVVANSSLATTTTADTGARGGKSGHRHKSSPSRSHRHQHPTSDESVPTVSTTDYQQYTDDGGA